MSTNSFFNEQTEQSLVKEKIFNDVIARSLKSYDEG